MLQTLNNLPVTYALDLWSFGCVLYQMLVGRPPFRDGSEYLTFQRISAGKFDLPDSVPPEAASLLRKLLVLRPEDRLGAPGRAFCAVQQRCGGLCRGALSSLRGTPEGNWQVQQTMWPCCHESAAQVAAAAGWRTTQCHKRGLEVAVAAVGVCFASLVLVIPPTHNCCHTFLPSSFDNMTQWHIVSG